MDARIADELRALRARAFGPAADIDDAGIARLRELEARARGAASARAPIAVVEHRDTEPDTDAPLSRDAPLSEEASFSELLRSGPEEAGAEDSEPPPPPPARRILPRWAWIAWPATLVAAAMIGATVAVPVMSRIPVAQSADAVQVTTLATPTEGDVALIFGPPDTAIAFDYFGLSVVVNTGLPGEMGGECLMIAATEDIAPEGNGINGPSSFGCRAGAFPATAAVFVDDESPQALRDQFGTGASLQFVVDGEVVGVFQGAPSSPPPTT